MPMLGRRPRVRLSSPLNTTAGKRRSKSLTASGERVRRQDMATQRRLLQAWQSTSFDFFDKLGEIKQASKFYSRMLAPLELYAAEFIDGEWVKTEDKDAIDALDRIQDPGGGRDSLQWDYGRLMFLIGETELFVSRDDYGDEQWEMLSPDELRIQDGVYYRYRAPSLGAEEYTPSGDESNEKDEDLWVPAGKVDTKNAGMKKNTAVAYRIWQRHPRWSGLADSTMRGVLDICDELDLLTKGVRARTRSRLAGNGVLFIDEDISPAPPEAAPDEDPVEDVWLNDLIDAMMSPLEDEGSAAAMVPLIARVKSKGDNSTIADLVHHLQLVDPTQLYPETGLRYECIKRLAVGLDMPPEELTGMTDANHWPCDEETEVFTSDRGFVTHDQLSAGDLVLSLNHDRGVSEWVPLAGVRREHVVDHEMVRVLGRDVDALTTPDHRWPVLRDGVPIWTDGAGLRPDDRIIRAVPHDSLLQQPVYSDDFVRLVGWYLSEGTCTWPSERHCQVRIGQSHQRNPGRVAEIRDLLTDLHGPAVATLTRPAGTPKGSNDVPPAWREQAEERGMTLFHLNKTAYLPLLDVFEPRSKTLRTSFVCSLTREQLLILLETVALGDGVLREGGGLDINQRDPARLEPLALAAILAGRPVTFVSQERQGGFSDGVQHYLRVPVARGYHVRVGETTRERYTGMIFCPKVPPTKSFLARRNGKVYFTGNTAWIVDENTWKAHGQQKADQLVNDLTSAYFRPFLRDVLGYGDRARKFAIKYDASAVINHPDKAKDAKDLHDRHAIGDEALREACGFDEDDAPTTEEMNRMIGIAIRDGSLAVYGIPSVKGGAIEPQAGEVEDAAGTNASGEGAKTAAEAEKGTPAKNGNGKTAEETVGPVIARIQGAADLALLRAREAAGSRLVSLANKNAKLRSELRGVRKSDVASVLGRERVRALKAPDERELVSGARDLIADALRLYGLDDPDIATVMCDTIERHAARTLYDRDSTKLPDTFALYVTGLVVKARLPHVDGGNGATRARPTGVGR